MVKAFCATKAPSSGAAEYSVSNIRILSLVALVSLTAADAAAAFDSRPDSIRISGSQQRKSLLAQATARREAHQFEQALDLYEQLLATDPRDADAFRMRVLTLSDIGSSYRAWQLYRNRPELFDAEQRERLELDYLARLIGWSNAYSEDEDTRLSEAETADEAITGYLGAQDPNGKGLPLRLRFDRLILLNRLGRHQQVADEYGALQKNAQTVPAYALGAVGDSLLALKEPEQAAKVLESALTADPDNPSLQVQLAYARLESEQPALAMARLREYAEAQPAWKYAAGARQPHQNWARYDADTTLAMLSAYTEDLPAAQKAMEQYVELAPANSALQTSLGGVYQMRGWPRRALERHRMAATLDERNVAARLGQVEALTALDRTDLARPLHDDLLRNYPLQSGVRRMDDEWRAHQGWQWRVHANGGRSESDGATVSASPLGNRDGQYGFEISSALFADRWRMTGMADNRWADFQGQRVHDRRQGVGIVYGFDRLEAAVGANHTADAPRSNGLELHAAWRLNDVWGIGLDARRNDSEASLQARAAGIAADSFGLSSSYVPNERTAMRIGLSQFRYDDGNRRSALSASLEQRVISQPRLLLNVLGAVYASRGTRGDAPYFNPSKDASVEAGLLADHLVRRDYDRHFRQRLNVSAGRYWQQGYGSAWVPSARYEHEWQFAGGKVLQYGANWSRPIYDGQREQRFGLDAEFRWGE